MLQAKLKKCKVCGELFTPYSTLAKACSVQCALELNKKARSKIAKKQLYQYRKANKSLGELKKEAQIAFNGYVRVRDRFEPCISCGKQANDFNNEWDAGHYRSVGSANHLRFYLLNNNKQCKHCNNFLSGNITDYRKGLIRKIGLERVEWIEDNNEINNSITKDFCERIKRVFNKKARLRAKQHDKGNTRRLRIFNSPDMS